MISEVLLILLLLVSTMSLFPALQAFVTRNLGIMSDSNTLTAPSGGQSNPEAATSPAPQNTQPAIFEPRPIDVVVIKAMLQQGLGLPPEVILSILDFAEYWPHTTTTLDRSLTVRAGRDSENKFVLRSPPLGIIKKTHYDDHYYSFTTASPILLSEDGEYPLSQFQDWIGSPVRTIKHPCRKIVFTIKSRDQGWGGNFHDHGTYRGSWTWFETGLERFDKNATCPKHTPEKEAPAAVHFEAAAAVLKDEAGESSTSRDQEKLSEPYLPVYALRPIYPTLQPDRAAFHHDLHPDQEWTIQYNKTATRGWTTHEVVWSWKDNVNPLTSEELKNLGRGEATGNGDFVRNLKLGDVVTVWAKARFMGWVNNVDSIKLDIYWAL